MNATYGEIFKFTKQTMRIDPISPTEKMNWKAPCCGFPQSSYYPGPGILPLLNGSLVPDPMPNLGDRGSVGFYSTFS